jgi:hypothetical protein
MLHAMIGPLLACTQPHGADEPHLPEPALADPPGLDFQLLCVVLLLGYLVVSLRGEADLGKSLRRLGWLALAVFVTEDTLLRAYDPYWYGESLVPFVDHVPLLSVLGWTVLLHSAWKIASRLCQRSPGNVWWVASLVAMADLAILGPVAVKSGVWVWNIPGVFGVPLVAFLAFGLFAAACVAFLSIEEIPGGRPANVVWRAALLTHSLVLVSWWGLFRWIAVEIPEWPLSMIAWCLSIAAMLVLALRQVGERLSRNLLVWRVPAVLCLFGALFFAGLEGSALWYYSLAFLPPYLLLLLRANSR